MLSHTHRFTVGVLRVLIAGTTMGAVAQSQTAADTGGIALEEIVVTAQRREEQAQNVPISIVALSAADIAAKGVQSSQDLTLAVPAVTWPGTLFGSPFVRGIGSNNTLPGGENNVQIFVDGVNQISPSQANFDFFGIQRVEVLEGPQGTLFGRNATGGVINITTLDPSSKAAADTSVTYGNFQTLNASFYGTTGLTDTLAANLTLGYHDQGQGWGRDISTGEEAFKDRTVTARTKLRWDGNAGTDATFIADYENVHFNYPSRPLGSYPAIDGSNITATGFWNVATVPPEEDQVQKNVIETSLTINHDFGFARLTSITAFTDVRQIWLNSVVGMKPEYVYAWYETPAQGWTQEVRLTSPTEQKLRWTAGVFYLSTTTAFAPLLVTGLDQGNALVKIFGRSGAQGEAAFADVTWAFLPTTSLTVGSRYSFDQRTIRGDIYVNGPAVGPWADQRASYRQPTYRVVLDHKITEQIMPYASVSTGYDAGSFNTVNPGAPALQPEKLTAYEVGLKSRWFDQRLQFNASAYYYDYKNLQTTVVTKLLTENTNAGKVTAKGLEASLDAIPIEHLTVSLSYLYNDSFYNLYGATCFNVAPGPSGNPLSPVLYGSFPCNVSGQQVEEAPRNSGTASIRYDLNTPVGSFRPDVTYAYKSSRVQT